MTTRSHLPASPSKLAGVLLALATVAPLPANPGAAHAMAPQEAAQALTGTWTGTAREQVDGIGEVRYPVRWIFSGGPNQAVRPPGARHRIRSHRCRLCTLWVTTMIVRPALARLASNSIKLRS